MKNQLTINGVRIGKRGVRFAGRYVPASYAAFTMTSGQKCVTIYARSILKDLPAELGSIINDTDTMTDYFETDRVRFLEGTPEYNALLPMVR
jgi:hypothetical protein